MGKVYDYRFAELEKEPLTLVWIYYDWAVYDIQYEAYLKIATAL